MASPPHKDTKRSIKAALYAGLGLKDSGNQIRDMLLVVAALITAVTFQAGVNPPGGVWQEDELNSTKPHEAGCAIYSSQEDAFYIFLTFNTLALSTSILVLILLTFKFPFRFEVLVATLSMFATYASSIFAISPDTVQFRFLLITAAAPFLARALFVIFKFYKPEEDVQE